MLNEYGQLNSFTPVRAVLGWKVDASMAVFSSLGWIVLHLDTLGWIVLHIYGLFSSLGWIDLHLDTLRWIILHIYGHV